MRGAKGGRWETVPLRIEPARGQVSEYGSKVPVSKEAWNVLQQDESGSHLANDPGGVGPHVPRVVLSESLAGDGEGRTGETRADDVDPPSPGGAVEVPDVGEDRERACSQESVALASAEDVPAVGIDLDGSHGAPPEKMMGSKESASGSGEESELIHFSLARPSHSLRTRPGSEPRRRSPGGP